MDEPREHHEHGTPVGFWVFIESNFHWNFDEIEFKKSLH